MASVIFYGAGKNAQENMERWHKNGLRPACFADSQINKQHTFIDTPSGKVEILPLFKALNKYPDYLLYLTQHSMNLESVTAYLLALGIPNEKIKYCDYPNGIVKISIINNYEYSHWKTLYPAVYNIFSRLQDDLSRAHFIGRLEYSLTHNIAGIYRAMLRDDYMQWISTKTTYANQHYGLNDLWQLLKENYPNQKNDIYLLAFDDNWNEFNWFVQRLLDTIHELGITIKGCITPYDAQEISEFKKITCLSEEDFLNRIDENSRIIVGIPGWSPKIKGIIERYQDYKDILFPFVDIGNPAYFEPDIFQPSEDEIFVDIGVFDLTSSIDFIRWAAKGFKKIYGFEPDPNCYKRSLKKLNEIDMNTYNKIELINKGLSSANDVLEFPKEYKMFGKPDIDTIDIEVVSLDSFLDGKPVTFVKMDVEGAEMDVLLGMQETILNYRPKLAVCIYHKHQDIFEIASYLISLVPEYKFYIRHYSSNEIDEVLLCTI